MNELLQHGFTPDGIDYYKHIAPDTVVTAYKESDMWVITISDYSLEQVQVRENVTLDWVLKLIKLLEEK